MNEKLDILAIAAHPDDVELCCSGTVLKHIAKGYSVGIVDLTLGELGTRGTAEIRATETEAASKIMGIRFRENLQMADGFFQIDKAHQLRIVEQIRRFRPEIIFTNTVDDRHPDHGRAGKLVSVSAFLSGLLKIETRWKGQIQEPHRPGAVYHFIQDRYMKPDFVVDITRFWEKKMETIAAYKSQFYNPQTSEPDTPISSKDFLDFIEARARDFGRQIGVKYAEGFTVERYIGVEDVMKLK